MYASACYFEYLFADSEGKLSDYTLLGYQFDEKKHNFVITSHGNAKVSKPYKRTQKSTMENIKTNAGLSKLRVLFDELTEKHGGIHSCKSIGALPRDRKQVENVRARLSSPWSSNGDPLLAAILKCKEDEREDVTNSFVRKVVAGPEPAAVLFLDKQLNDISKFCCNNDYWSPLQVDPTFDLGQFSVTTSQYKNLLVVNRRTGEHLSMMGPLLVHYRKSKSSFNVLVDAMIDKQPNIKNLRV